MNEREAVDVLHAIEHLEPKERAAALGHWIYVRTAHRGKSDWALRVSDAWEDLDTEAREFNLASIETWAQTPEVLNAFVAAVSAYRKKIEGGSGR
ncbi:MAG: hypothetical protein H7125_12115 [Proteobacteria bacterium]|nr:hypothetical protein [Burkholderiales bacterium]